MMKQLPTLLAAIALCGAAVGAVKADAVRDTALQFGAVADATCDEVNYQNESALLAAWAAKFAVNAIVGLASSMLEQATEKSTLTQVANAHGYLFTWDSTKSTWRPRRGCIRFWYGRQQLQEISVDENSLKRYGNAPANSELPWKAIAERWAKLALVEQPYLYGEVRLVPSESDNAMVLQPVVLFGRPMPGYSGFFRETKSMSVALDLKPLGAQSVMATHSIQIPDVSGGPILVRGVPATQGLASAWAAFPTAPTAAPKGTERTSIPFSALVTFTSTTDGTLFGKALASTFTAQKGELIAAITPKTKTEREAAEQAAMSAAFDAVGSVDDAQKALDAATVEADKPKLRTSLAKAQYLANMKLLAAGLPARYDVKGP